jgi:hypothetical protein
MPKLRNGHAPGHVRETALAAFDAWLDWNRLEEPEPTVEYEIQYVPRQITITRACGLVWNCTDVVPGHVFDGLCTQGLEVGRQTYAACARAIVEGIKTNPASGGCGIRP